MDFYAGGKENLVSIRQFPVDRDDCKIVQSPFGVLYELYSGEK